ncbi:IclR family transcriptional regulator [Sphingobium algorifonticola]|nr:IclR family transcriptional regulator [Sphingobium algorifonticola]
MATPRNKSVQKAFKMLRAFQEPNEWLTSAELSRRAQLPEASGYRLIQTLLEIGAVIRDDRGRYGPGMLLVSLSRYVAHERLLRDAANTILEDLAAELDLIVHMGVLEDGMVTYVAKAGTNERFLVHTRVGTQLEAYCSGLGKVLLAALPAHELEAFLVEGELIALTPNTITDAHAFRDEIALVRRRGWAIDNCEIANDLRCVAVPVIDSSGRTVAAISSSDSADRMTEARLSEVRDALAMAARAIGAQIYRTSGPSPFRLPAVGTEAPLLRSGKARSIGLPGRQPH